MQLAMWLLQKKSTRGHVVGPVPESASPPEPESVSCVPSSSPQPPDTTVARPIANTAAILREIDMGRGGCMRAAGAVNVAGAREGEGGARRRVAHARGLSAPRIPDAHLARRAA